MSDDQVEFQDLLEKGDSAVASGDKRGDREEDLEEDREGGEGDGDEEPEEKTWKQRLQVALIHFALLFVSIIYAVFGSLIFYHIESPHEHLAKENGIRKIENFRESFVSSMWNASRLEKHGKQEWLKLTDQQLRQFTDVLYVAYKKEYVKFHDIAIFPPLQPKEEPEWTNPSALFFSVTTLATIGYGNVVPITQQGRIICVCFALFGTPLAIITIGDMGKFVSECIITVYKRYKKLKKRLRCFPTPKSQPVPEPSNNNLSPVKEEFNEGDDDDEEYSDEDEAVTYEDLLMHRIQVPVVLVFGILVLYMALGAILFSVIEGWTYVESFYFCFISLTTIGFGDLVPRQHKYMIIMLTYIGFGLAVTTMCIDLVGRQYVWKIHYFGRKFKEADLLQLLRRKRMIERQLAIAQQNVDIKQLYMDAIEKQVKFSSQQLQPQPVYLTIDSNSLNSTKYENAVLSSVHTLSPQWPVDNVFTYDDAKIVVNEINGNSIMPAEISPVSTTPSYYTRLKMLLSGKNRPSISSPSGPSIELQCSLTTSPSVYEKEFDFQRRLQSSHTSWTPSGPDVSIECSLATSPEVYEREDIYSRMPSYYSRSPDEFEYEFRLPSPDFEELGKVARSTKRLASCPGEITIPPPPPVMMSEMVECVSINTLVEESQETNLQSPKIAVTLPSRESDDENILPPALLSPVEFEYTFEVNSSVASTPLGSPAESVLDFGDAEYLEVDFADFDLPQEETVRLLSPPSTSSYPGVPVGYHRNMPVFTVSMKAIETEQAVKNVLQCPEQCLSTELPKMVTENYCFVVDGDKFTLADVTADDHHWRHTGRPTKYYYSEDLKTFQKVHIVSLKGKVISAKLVAPNNRSRSHSMSSPQSPKSPLTRLKTSDSTPISPHLFLFRRHKPQTENKEVSLDCVYKVTRSYSFWKTCTTFHRIITIVLPLNDQTVHPDFKRRIFVQYLWRNAKESDRTRVLKEFDMKNSFLMKNLNQHSPVN